MMQRLMKKVRRFGAKPWSARSIRECRAAVEIHVGSLADSDGRILSAKEVCELGRKQFGKAIEVIPNQERVIIWCRLADAGEVLAACPGIFVMDRYDVSIEL